MCVSREYPYHPTHPCLWIFRNRLITPPANLRNFQFYFHTPMLYLLPQRVSELARQLSNRQKDYFIMFMGPAIAFFHKTEGIVVGGKIKGERNCGYAQMEDSECAVEFNVILVQFEQWRKMQTKLASFFSLLLLCFKGATSQTTHLEKIGNFFQDPWLFSHFNYSFFVFSVLENLTILSFLQFQ